jgi:sugar-specific transcriptional regulator TrmB
VAIVVQSDNIITDLMHLGLHKNEAKAYKTLVSLGSSSARTVADHSGVPRSKVYEILYALENKGMARRTAGTEPVEFTPIEPQIAISYLEEKMSKSAEAAKITLSELAKNRSEENLEITWTVVGEDQIKLEARSLLERAEREVFIATRNIAFLRSLKTSMVKAKQSGVDIKLVTMGHDDSIFSEFGHYISPVNLKEISSEDIVASLERVIGDSTLQKAGWDPDQISILIRDDEESLGIFRNVKEHERPWALHIRSPLVVIFQRQVIVSLMAAIDRMLSQFLEIQ